MKILLLILCYGVLRCIAPDDGCRDAHESTIKSDVAVALGEPRPLTLPKNSRSLQAEIAGRSLSFDKNKRIGYTSGDLKSRRGNSSRRN